MKNLTGSTLENNYHHSLTDQHQLHPKQHSSLHQFEPLLPNVNINPSYDYHRKCSFQHQLLPPHQPLMPQQAHLKESSVLYHSHPTLLQLPTANTNNRTSTIFPMIKLTYPNHGLKSMNKTNTCHEDNDRFRFNFNDHPVNSSKTKSTHDLMVKQNGNEFEQNRSYPNISSIFKSNKGRLDLSFTKCQFPDDYLPYAVSSSNDRRTFSPIIDDNLFNKKRSNSFDVIGFVNTNNNNTGRYHQRSASDFQPSEEEVKHRVEVNDWQLNEYNEECCSSVSTVKKQQRQPTMEIVVSKLNVCHDDDQLGFNDRKIANETPLTSTATATSSSSIVLDNNNHNDNQPKRSALFFTYPFYSPFRSSSSFNDQSTTGSGLGKSSSKNYRHGLIKSFGCCVLMLFVVLILLSLSIVLGFSLYLAIVTNLFTETTFAYSLNGNFKIISGDNFTIKLINQTSAEFLKKSSRYEKILHKIFHASILSESILHHEIYSFRQGSLIVFFRFYTTKRTFDRILDIKKSKTIINFGTIENVYLDDDVIVAQIRQILFHVFQEKWPTIIFKNLSINSRTNANTMLEMDFNSLKISTFERLTESQYLDRLKRRRIYHQYDIEELDDLNSIMTNNDLQKIDNNDDDISLNLKKNFTSSLPSSSINFITKSISTTTTSTTSPTLMPTSINNINKIVSLPTLQTNNSTTTNNQKPSTGSILTTIADDQISPVNLDQFNGTFLNNTNDNRVDLVSIVHNNITNSSLNLNNSNWNEFNNNITLTKNEPEFFPETREDLDDQSIFDVDVKNNRTFFLKTENFSTFDMDSTKNATDDQTNDQTIDGFWIDANKESTEYPMNIQTTSNLTTINNNKVLIKSEDSFDLYSVRNSTKTTLFNNFNDDDDDDDEDIESEFKLKPTTAQDITTSTLTPTTISSEFVNNSLWNNNIENEFTHMVTTEPNTLVTVRPVLAYGTRISKKLFNYSISNKYRPSSHENSLFNDDYYNSIDQVDKYITTVISTKNKLTTTTTPPPILCQSNEIRCNRTDTCIPFESICNKIMDCEDGSDELDCRCVDYLLRDETHRHKLCDGIIDCADLSDETANCPRCSEGMFVCIGHGSQCINMSKVCNGENDCINGDDEQNCIALIDNEEFEVNNSNGQNFNSLLQSHNPSGLLHIQHHGQWAPLCFDSYDLDSENWIDHRYDENDTISENNTSISISSMIQIDDMGQAVCKANYFAHLERIQIITAKNLNITNFYAISPKITDSIKPTLSIWSSLFEKTDCKDRKVARIECSTIECGVRPLSSKIQRRIIGGQSSAFGSWPWQVALYREGEFQCGAVVIDSQWLLTAAHCFYSTPGAFWTARIGVLRRGSLHRSFNEEIRNIERVFIHPEYVDKGFLNDIALLRLDRPLTYSKYIRPICLPEEDDSRISKWNNQLCTTIGWGKLFEHGRIFPDSLQEVKLPIISTDECRKRTMFLPLYKITNNMFCAGFEYGGRDACLGDSGGPMMCQKENGKWILLGITSNGDGCGRAGRPGVYTKVFNYLDWIQSIIIEGRFGKRMESDSPQYIMDKLNKNNSTNNLKKSICTGHRCPLGRCIKVEQICDHIIDCEDSSDERNCPEFKFIN